MRIGVIVPEAHAQAVLDAGADYVEPTVVDNIVEKTDDGWVPGPAAQSGRRDAGFAILFPGTVRLSDPDFDEHRITDYLDVAIPAIAAVAEPGAKVVLGSGGARRVPEGVDIGEAGERLAAVVRQTARSAEATGLELVLEPLNRSETNLLHTIVECITFLDDHGLHDVRVVADLYHMMLEGEELSVLVEHGHRIGHAHVADTGRGLPGTGDWPIAEFLQALHDGGYSGNVSIETSYTDEDGRLGPAIAHLRGLLPR